MNALRGTSNYGIAVEITSIEEITCIFTMLDYKWKKNDLDILYIFYRFKNCWPAIRKGVHGVILVYSAKMQDSSKQLKEFYDYFVSGAKLGPNNCVIFFFDSDNATSSASKIICKYINKYWYNTYIYKFYINISFILFLSSSIKHEISILMYY